MYQGVRVCGPLVLVIGFMFVFSGCSDASVEDDTVPMDDFDLAAAIADKAFYAAKEILYEAYERNLVEKEVINAIDAAMLSNGSDPSFGFTTLVASGPDSAIPHGDPSNDNTKVIKPGEVVWTDYGPKKNGKCADETRTFLMYPVPEEAAYVYNIILEAQEEALKKIKDGAIAGDADFAARSVFEKYGYAPHFIHSLGHGMGTQVHEPPTLGPGSTEIIPAGKIVSDEPGLYFGGDFGIRVEDDIRSMPSNGQVITFAPKSLDDVIIYPPIAFDKQGFMIPDTATIVIHDNDFNKDPGTKDTTTAEVVSTTEGTPEVITLTETGVNTAIFKGTIPVVSGAPAPDGKISVKDGDTITARYQDPSPSKQRTTTAKADSVLPVISNVASLPDVASVVITWETSEPTNGTIFYGISPALGNIKKEFGLRKSHSVLLVGLVPNTTYYFDVAAWDSAHNMLRSDNSGAHYTFRTLEGIDTVPSYGYVGYVSSAYPSQNFFKSTKMYSGYSSGGNTYYGAFQFEISGIPAGATIIGASVSIYGVDWDTKGSGNWKLGLLNSSEDANWQTKTYTSISGAKVDAYLTPALSQNDLKPRSWNTFNFSSGQINDLLYQISKGKSSFRLEGPTSYGLFFWATGYFPGSLGDIFRPHMTIRYTTSSDMKGPDALNLSVTPNPTEGATDIVLTGKISDISSGGSIIAGAEWFEGSDPGPGNGKPLSAKDGSFDSPEEEVRTSIDITAWALGVHDLWVRGKDIRGNWGNLTKVSFTKTLPKLEYVEVTPHTVDMKVGEVQMFSARAFSSRGIEIKSGVNYTWSLAGGIGSVVPDTGKFTNLTATTPGMGILTVSAEFGGITRTNSSNVHVTAQTQMLSYVSLEPKNQTITIGSTLEFTAKAIDMSGNELSGAAYTWSVTGGIGTLNRTTGGSVKLTATGFGSGVVGVTASFGGDSRMNTSDVVVARCLHICDVRISPIGIEMIAGEKRTFTAAGIDSDGNTIPSGVTYHWEVTEDGRIIQSSGNSAVIEATSEGRIRINVTANYQGEWVSSETSIIVHAKKTEQVQPLKADIMLSLAIIVVAVILLILLLMYRRRKQGVMKYTQSYPPNYM